MYKLKELAKAVLGAAGWCILGVMILVTGIGPWWIGWLAVLFSLPIIINAVDKALEPTNKWPV